MTLLIVYLGIAIGVSFLCSILEAVLLSLTPTFVEKLSSERPKAGAVAQQVRKRMDESLSSILILNTFAHTMGAAGVGAQALKVFGPEMETLVAVLLTLAILYFSEIIPKTLGARYWRQLAIPAAHTIVWLVRITYPLVWISTRLTKVMGNQEANAVTRDEILALVSLGQRHGALMSQENTYLQNTLRLRGVTTGDILTPRTVVHMLQEDMTVNEALENELTRRFSRMPVYIDSVDSVTGHVLRSDIYEAERTGGGENTIASLQRDVVFVSEKMPVHKLINKFIRQQIHLFIVEDKYGQTAGVVTLEDALETLLGEEIVDESDSVADMQALAKEKHRDRIENASSD